jgi:S-DNA-T family DNA segregation ATPase FtsK/SpoIIIE
VSIEERHEPATVEMPPVDAELVRARPRIRVHAQRLAGGVRTVATHEYTKTAGRTTARHTAYIPLGAWVLAKRLWEAKTNSRYERILRAAEAANDWDRLEEWEDRAEAARERRHKRRMDWLKAPGQLARVVLAIVATWFGLLLLLGIVLWSATGDPSRAFAPILGFVHFVQLVAYAIAIAWGPFLLALPWLVLAVCWWVGQANSQRTPAWMQTNRPEQDGVVIDERSIAHALRHLGIAAADRFFRDGGVLSYTKLPARDGALGVVAQVRLPPGVSAEEVIRAKERLAANLGRSAIEVWPSTGEEAGLLELWIADRGALDTGAGPWPWVERADPINFYEGVPIGRTLRGEQVIAPVDGASWLIGGRPGQGKSNLGRLLVAGACLDPHAEIWTYVLADTADFDALAGRFARYEVGMGADVIQAAVQGLHDLLAEMERRGRVMRKRKASTAARAGFHPILMVVDESHRMFQAREVGKEAAQVAEDVIKQARKYGIVLMLMTQSPTATSIPKEITREVVCRVAFSVVDHVGNDALLGTGHHKRGIRATDLRPGSEHSPGDRGKALTVGVVPDVDWSMLIGHYLTGDELAAVAERAGDIAATRGPGAAETVETRDLLADVAEVLGVEERCKTTDVAARLRKLAPTYRPYRELDGKRLTEWLEASGLRVTRLDGYQQVHADRVRQAREVSE